MQENSHQAPSHVSSVTAAVLNRNYVLVHVVTEQGIGESKAWILRLWEVLKDHRDEMQCRTQICFLIYSCRSWQETETHKFLLPIAGLIDD